MQQQGISRGDVLQRLASLFFIVGSVSLIVFNALFPRVEDPASAAQFVKKVAETRGGQWEMINLGLAVGIWGLMIGFAGVYRAISTGGAAAWARLGYYGFIVGTTLWTAGLALEGFGLGLVTKDMSAATTATAAVLASLLMGLLSMQIIVLWLALLFIGIGMALSTVFPGWAGWVLIILGALTASTGVLQGFTGPTQLTLNVLFPILAGLSTVYSLVLGIWIWRRAW